MLRFVWNRSVGSSESTELPDLLRWPLLRPIARRREAIGAARRHLEFEIVDDLESGVPEKPQPVGNRQIEFDAAGIDFDTRPVDAMQSEIGAMETGFADIA